MTTAAVSSRHRRTLSLLTPALSPLRGEGDPTTRPSFSCVSWLISTVAYSAFSRLNSSLFPANIRLRLDARIRGRSPRNMRRTHHCNELRPAHLGQTVTLSGWVHSRRDLGGLLFIDIRDREGRTQTVFDPSDLPKELFDRAASLHSESVISVSGKVRPRPEGTN